MAYLELLGNKEKESSANKTIKILIFTEGTILGPKNISQHFNHASYIPEHSFING
jgi:hypothetical protein